MSARDSVLDAIARGLIEAADTQRALVRVGGVVTAGTWRRLALAFLLGAGLLAIAVGLAFFIAWNWDDLHRFAKFGLVAGALVAALAGRLLARPGGVLAAAMVPVLLLVIGVLLALTGQVYQSGADRWELFALWGAIALPLVIAARSFYGWLPWLALLNVAVALLAGTRALGLAFLWSDRLAIYWLLAFANGSFGLLVATGAIVTERPALTAALRRIALIVAGACLTVLAVAAILEGDHYRAASLAGWLAGIVALWYRYRRLEVDLPILAGVALSICVVAFALFMKGFSKVFERFDFGVGVLLALVIFGLATLAGRWLLQVQRSVES